MERPFPQRLSETGLFENTPLLWPAPGVIPYAVNAPLWADYAGKQRWIALPEGGSIEFDPPEPWMFPVGTVLVKHFDLEMVSGDPNSTRKLETRVLVFEDTGWAGYTYKWNEQQTDAELLQGSLLEELSVVDVRAPTGHRDQLVLLSEHARLRQLPQRHRRICARRQHSSAESRAGPVTSHRESAAAVERSGPFFVRTTQRRSVHQDA